MAVAAFFPGDVTRNAFSFAGGEDKGSIGSCGFESPRAPTSTRSSMAEQSLGDDSPATFSDDERRC